MFILNFTSYNRWKPKASDSSKTSRKITVSWKVAELLFCSLAPFHRPYSYHHSLSLFAACTVFACPSVPPFCCILSPSPLWTLHPYLSISLSSLSSGTHKPKDPPWLALVQSDSKKKKAPAPPPAGLATPPNTGSLSSLKGDGSRSSTPPPPANPFDEDDDDENNEVEEEEGSEGGAVPASVAASHPWYSISRAADASGGDTPPSGGSSSRSASPGSTKNKKRPAPRAPQPPAGSQGQLN